MGSGFLKNKKAKQGMESNFFKLQEQLQSLRVTGSAPNDFVTIVLTGDKSIESIKIHPEALSDGEALQDLIMTAFQDAEKKLEGAAGRLSSGLSF